MTQPGGAACLNCGATAGGRFCPDCGQEQREARVSLGAWLSDLLDEFALSAKLPLTLGLLFSRPGFLSSEWRVGRRARYVSALRVYILASIVFFSVTFFVGLPIIGELELGFDDLGTEIAGNAGQLVNTVIARRMQGFLTLGAALSVPLLALWVKLLRRRSEILYVDHLVLSLHLHAVAFFGFTVAYVALFFGLPGYIIAGLIMSYVFGYWVAAWWRTYAFAGRPVRSLVSLTGTGAGVGLIGLLILVLEMVLAGNMIGSSDNITNVEIANRAYALSRRAFYAGDLIRARHVADVGIPAFAALDSAALVDHLPYHDAEIRRFAGQHEEALTRAERLLAAEPNDLLALGLAGVSAEEAGDSEGASLHYERLLALADSGVENARGHETALRRFLFSARVFTDRASGEDMREVAFRTYLRAGVVAASGDTASARLLAGTALDAFADPDAALQPHDRFHQAELLFLIEDYPRVIEFLREDLGEDGDDVLALGLAGAAAERMGDRVAAQRYSGRMVELVDAGIEPAAGHDARYADLLATARAFASPPPA